MAIKSITTFLNNMKEQKKSTQNTVDSYSRDLYAFYDFLRQHHSRNLAAASNKDIQEYIDSLKKDGKSSGTIIRSLSAIRSYYQFLIVNGLIITNPAKNIKYESVERKPPESLSFDEIKSLLNQPKCTNPKGFRDKAMLELLYATGMKVTELLELKMSDINLSLKTVLVNRGKKTERIIPLHNDAVDALDEYTVKIRPLLLADKTDIIFLNNSGAPLTRQGFWKVIKTYAESAGITKRITPQIIRNSVAIHMFKNGADLQSVKEMLGHVDIASTQGYAKLIANENRDIYEKYHPKA